MTKKQQRMYENYLNATDVTIWDAYKNPCENNVIAYKNLVQECINNHGGPWVIPTHSCMNWTFAYDFHMDGKRFLRYHTRDNVYTFEIPKVETGIA